METHIRNIVLMIGLFVSFTITSDSFSTIKENYKKYRLKHIFKARQLGYKKPSAKLLKQIFDYSVRFDRDYERMLRWVYAESRFNPEAISYKGAMGLLQMMPQTATYVKNYVINNPSKFPITEEEYRRIVEMDDLFIADNNLLLANCFIKMLFKDFHKPRVVLARYYAGHNWEYHINGNYVKSII